MNKPPVPFFLLLVIVCLLCSSAQAQIPLRKDFVPERYDPFYERTCNSTFTNIPLQVKDDPEEAVTKYLKENNPNLSSPQAGLTILHNIESPGGRHMTFEQTYSGMPIFHSEVKVNLNKSNRIRSIFDNSWSTEAWEQQSVFGDFENLDIAIITSLFGNQRSLDGNHIKRRKVIAVLDDRPVVVVEIELWDGKTDEHLMLLADNAMNIFLKRDLNAYRRDSAAALVFIPDPLTSAHKNYGTPYVDDSNRDVSVINAQRMAVAIEATFTGGSYKLQNQFAVISDFSIPNIPPVESFTPDFNFTRAQTGFEDVNAFYHITIYSQYVQSLGFGGLVTNASIVDAHALDGKDQSMFSFGFNGPQLFFGEGGVDDAEDADVIVHELGHALSYSASPNSNNGSERTAIDEGLCDYLATSYSRSIDTFRWNDMFTWDGHNQYWNGRTANTNKVYPNDLVSSIHSNGEIYNAALMKIWENIGREKSDRILLQSLYGLTTGMSMKAAAMLLYDADSALYNGAHFCVIFQALFAKGLTDTYFLNSVFDTIYFADLCRQVDPSIAVKAGSDQIICASDIAVLGDNLSFEPGYIYGWSPASGLSAPNSNITNATPTETTDYILTASRFDGSFNTDTVRVTYFRSCFLNTEGFKTGEATIIKLPPDSEFNTIELFDISGKRLFKFSNIPAQDYSFSGNLLAPGVYILRVSSSRGKETQKLVKLNRQ